MRKVILIGFFVFLVFFMSVITNVPAQQSATNAITFVNEVSSVSTSSLDPATNYDSFGMSLTQVLYDRLFAFDGNNASLYVPGLALNYSVSPDGLQYQFNLRQGVTFSDGQPFNAYTMEYSLFRALIINDVVGPAFYSLDGVINGTELFSSTTLTMADANTFLSLQSIQSISTYVLNVTLSKPSSNLISILAEPIASAISPKSIIDNEPSSYTTDQSDTTFGMISLTDMFPGMSNATILSNLGLPSNYDPANSGIVPQSDVAGPAVFTWLKDHAAGTGPYTLQSYSSGVQVTLVQNTNWWNKANFNANAPQTVEIKQSLGTTGNIYDLMNATTDSAFIPLSSYSQIMNTTTKTSLFSNLNVYTYPSVLVNLMSFNLADSLPSGQIVEDSVASNYSYGSMNYTKLQKFSWNFANGTPQMASKDNPFTSLLFRKAFAYSFDYDTYIQNEFGNFGFRAQGVIPKGILGHVDNLISRGLIPSYNLTAAKELFNQVGFKGTITMYFNSGSTSREDAETLLKNSIESLGIGININVQSVSYVQYLGTVLSGKGTVLINTYAPDYSDPSSFVSFNLESNQFIPKLNHYNNSYVDSLLNLANNQTNLNQRIATFKTIEENASQDYDMIYLSQTENVLVVNKGIQDISTSGSLNPMYYGLNYQYLGKTGSSTIPTSTTTSQSTSSSTTTTTSTSSTSTTTTTTTTTTIEQSTSSSSSTQPNNSTSQSNTKSSPGFEMVSLLGIVAISVIYRKKSK